MAHSTQSCESAGTRESNRFFAGRCHLIYYDQARSCKLLVQKQEVIICTYYPTGYVVLVLPGMGRSTILRT